MTRSAAWRRAEAREKIGERRCAVRPLRRLPGADEHGCGTTSSRNQLRAANTSTLDDLAKARLGQGHGPGISD